MKIKAAVTLCQLVISHKRFQPNKKRDLRRLKTNDTSVITVSCSKTLYAENTRNQATITDHETASKIRHSYFTS